MSKKQSSVWLIIFLAAIVYLLGWLRLNAQHQKEVVVLEEEIIRLTGEMEQLKEAVLFKNKISSPSMSLEPVETTPAGQLKEE